MIICKNVYPLTKTLGYCEKACDYLLRHLYTVKSGVVSQNQIITIKDMYLMGQKCVLIFKDMYMLTETHDYSNIYSQKHKYSYCQSHVSTDKTRAFSTKYVLIIKDMCVQSKT